MSDGGKRQPEIILCDTSYVLQISRAAKRPEIVQHWPSEVVYRLEQAQLVISVITIAELRTGVVHLSGERARQDVENRLAAFAWIPLDMQVVDRWAEMMRGCRSAGMGDPKHNDVWIAATAAIRDLPLATCDREQCRIPGVNSVYLPRDPDSGDP